MDKEVKKLLSPNKTLVMAFYIKTVGELHQGEVFHSEDEFYQPGDIIHYDPVPAIEWEFENRTFAVVEPKDIKK